MSKITYLIRRAAGIDRSGLRARTEQVRAVTGRSRLRIHADMALCALRYGAGYIDYAIFGMYALNGAQRAALLTRGKNTRYVRALNCKEDFHYFQNKPEFLNLFQAECGREYLDLTQSTEDAFLAFCARHPAFMAKPGAGLCGKGVEKRRAEGNLHALYLQLKTGGQTLVEELLTQHEAVSRLYPGAINTVRMVTMLDDAGAPHLLYTALRMGSGGSVVDNFNSGGMVIPIDAETGRLVGVAVNKEGAAFSAHPDTGVPFGGYPLPCWSEACALALAAAVRVPTVRLVGWDLALTPGGPKLVEGNHYPGHDIYQLVPQNPEKKGMLPVFDAVVPYASLKSRIKKQKEHKKC